MMLLSSIFSAYQISTIALATARSIPDASQDEIGCAVDFVLTMIEDLDGEDQEEATADINGVVESVVVHIKEVMRAVPELEEVDTSWVDLAA